MVPSAVVRVFTVAGPVAFDDATSVTVTAAPTASTAAAPRTARRLIPPSLAGAGAGAPGLWGEDARGGAILPSAAGEALSGDQPADVARGGGGRAGTAEQEALRVVAAELEEVLEGLGRLHALRGDV